MPSTPCPHCRAPLPVGDDERAVCEACNRPVRFVEVPDERVRFVATCPRCRRRIDVAKDASEHVCPHCAARMGFQDTF